MSKIANIIINHDLLYESYITYADIKSKLSRKDFKREIDLVTQNPIVDVLDFKMKMEKDSAQDLCYLNEFLKYGYYEPEVSKFLLNNLNKDTIFVDAGSNSGYYSLLAGQRCKRVYAFEPVSYSYRQLLENIRLNKLSNIKPFNLALSNKHETGNIYVGSKSGGGAGSLYTKTATIQPVRIERLDNIIKKRVDIIKIDVEGAETEVIEGAQKLLSEYGSTIIFEYSYHSLFKRDIKERNRPFEVLKKSGYLIKHLDTNGKLTGNINHYKEMEHLFEYLVAIKSEN